MGGVELRSNTKKLFNWEVLKFMKKALILVWRVQMHEKESVDGGC